MLDDLVFTPPPKRHFDPWAYVFVAPAVVLLAVFLFIPALWALLTSFAPETPGSASLGGISAYVAQLKSDLFWRAVLNTMYFAGVYVPGGLLVGYFLACLIRRKMRSRAPLVILFFAPALVPGVASGAMWGWMYDPDGGLVSRVLAFFGCSGADWLHEPKLALPGIALMCVWQSAGLIAVIFLAAMSAIPREYGEMADLDGARGWRRFRYVVLPSLGNATRVSLLLLLINAHRVFGAIFVMTRDGGPANWSTTLSFLVYREAMKQFDFRGACALSTVVCFTVAIMVVLLHRFPVPGRGEPGRPPSCGGTSV